MRALLAIMILTLGSCGGSPTGPDEQPTSEPPAAEPPTSGTVILDISGTVTFPDGRVASGMEVTYRSCGPDPSGGIFPDCDFYDEGVTGHDGRYALTHTVSRDLCEWFGTHAVLIEGLVNGECWHGRHQPIVCTEEPQTINVTLRLSSSPYSC